MQASDTYCADSMGRRNRQWAADRALRPAMRSPGRPGPRLEVEREFWRLIATGATSEDAAAAVDVSGPVGSRWFRHGGEMPPICLAGPSGRYLSFAEREEIAPLAVRRSRGEVPFDQVRELRCRLVLLGEPITALDAARHQTLAAHRVGHRLFRHSQPRSRRSAINRGEPCSPLAALNAAATAVSSCARRRSVSVCNPSVVSARVIHL